MCVCVCSVFDVSSLSAAYQAKIVNSIFNLNFAFDVCIVKNLTALWSTFAGFLAPVIVAIVLFVTFYARWVDWTQSLVFTVAHA